MKTRKTVTVGMVGAGYAAWLHGCGYEKVAGVDVRLKRIVDVDEAKAAAIAEQFGFESHGKDISELLCDPEIDVIDIVTPPFLHVAMIEQALRAGKHVICEKPLTGYFGREGDPAPVGSVPKEKMLRCIEEDLARLEKVVAESGKQFMFAENFVYATPIRRTAQLIAKKKSKVLYLKGEQYLKGSSSPLAGQWSGTGGGTLVRGGTHPLSGLLYLKSVEAAARGEDIRVQSVLADVGTATAALSEYEHRHISARPQDVEDFASVTITFSDGSKAVVLSADVALGGTKNAIEVYCNDAAYTLNITPTDLMSAYFLDEEGIGDEKIGEMLPMKLGWNHVFVSDEVIRGYQGELQDFCEAAAENRAAESDFRLAAETARVLYAAYLSAETGRRVTL